MNKTKRAVLVIREATGKRIRQLCLEEPFPKSHNIYILGYHLKPGHTLSVQNRPTGLAEDMIVLPCVGARLQGADSVVKAVLDV